ncbi:MAG: hypothetical protein JW837_11690 [Sedimentisphaerales bacterium]|nr:hypothetical protein [Sedimentisphaerales bacterium]
MDTLEGIEKLAQKACREEAPLFAVSDKVISRIGAEDSGAFNFTVFEIFATASAVVASVVGYLSIGAWRFVASPLMQFFTPLQEIRLW